MAGALEPTIHIHSGGIVGGYSVCNAPGNRGKLVDDADKANCRDCITMVRDWAKYTLKPGHKLLEEAKRACANIGLPWED